MPNKEYELYIKKSDASLMGQMEGWNLYVTKKANDLYCHKVKIIIEVPERTGIITESQFELIRTLSEDSIRVGSSNRIDLWDKVIDIKKEIFGDKS